MLHHVSNHSSSSSSRHHQRHERQQAPRTTPLRRRRAACGGAAGAPADGASTSTRSSDLQLIPLLKEWAVTCSALGDGAQTILLRKGGIAEPRFTPLAKEFFVFPTAFHTQEALLKPSAAEAYAEALAMDPKALPAIPLRHWARVTGAWVTQDPSVLQQLDPLHVWSPAFLETRLKWRPAQPLTLLELRCYTLAQPLLLPAADDLWGCFSWLQVPPERLQQQPRQQAERGGGGGGGGEGEALAALLRGAAPALGDAAFEDRRALLRRQLQHLQAEVLPL